MLTLANIPGEKEYSYTLPGSLGNLEKLYLKITDTNSSNTEARTLHIDRMYLYVKAEKSRGIFNYWTDESYDDGKTHYYRVRAVYDFYGHWQSDANKEEKVIYIQDLIKKGELK